MKKISMYIGAMLIISSCSKSWIDVNDNPNTPSISRSDWQFSGALNTTVSNTTGPDGIGGAWGGYFGFSTSFTGGSQAKTYIFSNSDFNYWDNQYDNLFDYQYVIKNGDAEGYGYLVGPAKIMQAFIFQRLVDMYNNIPYSQFGNINYITPEYDDAKSVYENLIKKIDSAITSIKAATWPASAPADIMFAGDKTKWIKFGNTLKLRILIRQAFVSGRDAYITGEINKIVAEGSGFLSTNVLVNPGYAKQPNKLNFFYSTFGYNENDAEVSNHQFYKASAFLVNELKAKNDSFRLQRKIDVKPASIRLDKTVSSDPAYPSPINRDTFANYIGVPLGASSGFLTANSSPVGPVQIVKGEATRPMVLFTAAESYFLQAEAAQRYGLLGSAQSLYEEGVRQSFQLDAGIGTSSSALPQATAIAKANAYLATAQDNVSWTTSTNKLRAIYYQKWLALAFYNNFEAWTEWRRTKYPAVPHSTSSGANPVEPRRFYYPITEYNTNLDNLNKQGAINVYTSRIFWDIP